MKNPVEGLPCETYWSLATPYSKFPAGLELAFQEVFEAAGKPIVYMEWPGVTSAGA